MQICSCRAHSPPSVNVPVKACETLLFITVYIVSQGITCFLYCFKKRAEQRILAGTSFHDQGAFSTPERISARQTVFHAFEIGQAVRVIPIFHTGITGPAFIILGISTLKNHAVNTARSSKHFTTSMKNTTVVHKRFRF